MLRKKEVAIPCKRCGAEFSKKRTEQEFCSAQCRNAAWKKPRKRRLKGTPLGSVANGPFSSIKTEGCKPPSTPDLGAFVRAQIVAQEEEPNPIGFTLPDGTKGRAWLASDNDGSKIIGDDRLWRVNTEELLRQKERRPKASSWLPTAETLRRPIIVVGRNDPVRDVDDALQYGEGFKLRICIEGEKELQILGCGWRIVTCQISRRQSSPSPQWQRRGLETQSLQGIAGCHTGCQAQEASTLFAIGGFKSSSQHR